MGSIQEKLDYLNETKQEIKQAIVSKGVEVDDTDSFRSYAEKITEIEGGGGITPSGTIEIKENGTYDVTSYASAEVDVPIPEPVLQEKTATENGEVIADEGYDGLSKVIVDVPSSGGINFLQWKCDNMRRLDYEFYYYSGESLDEFFNGLDTSKLLRTNRTFDHCQNMTSAPFFDTSSVISMQYMFTNCHNLTSVPLYDTSEVTDMSYMFEQCVDLTTIPLFDTSKVTNMNGMFSYCKSLVTAPILNTSLVVGMQNMFAYDEVLTTIPYLDMYYVNSTSSIFTYCKALQNLTLKNIRLTSLQIGSGTLYGTLLTDESLINTAKELWVQTSSKRLTVSTPSNARFDAIYVKLIDITDEMRAEDQYIDNKKPCVVCESTDEGAMTLREYVVSKNWTLST